MFPFILGGSAGFDLRALAANPNLFLFATYATHRSARSNARILLKCFFRSLAANEPSIRAHLLVILWCHAKLLVL